MAVGVYRLTISGYDMAINLGKVLAT